MDLAGEVLEEAVELGDVAVGDGEERGGVGVRRRRPDVEPFTWITATSVVGSLPTSVAESVSPLLVSTEREDAPATTCALVTMSPLSSITKPVPCAWPDGCAGPNGLPPCEPDSVDVISTIPPTLWW